MGIPFLYILYMCWKVVAYQNATPDFTRNVYAKEQAHLFLIDSFQIYICGGEGVDLLSYAERNNLIDRKPSY